MNNKIKIIREIKMRFLIKKVYRSIRKKINDIKFDFFTSKKHKQIEEGYITSMKLSENMPFNIDSKEIIDEAWQIENSHIILFGHLKVKKGIHGYEWNRDLTSNIKFENKYFRSYTFEKFCFNGDVRVVWELSRFNHLSILSKAYLDTHNSMYIQEFISQLYSWNESNPYLYSINWTCSMEVGIRAVNILSNFILFRKKHQFDFKTTNFVNNLLYKHGEYIYGNLENYGFVDNNHYLTNIITLLWLSVYFIDLKNNQIKKWYKKSTKLYYKTLKKQTNDDGTNFESSTYYHAFITEMLYYTDLMLKTNSISYDKKIEEILSDYLIFTKRIVDNSGKIPIIGDSDTGRFLTLRSPSTINYNDFSHMFSSIEYNGKGSKKPNFQYNNFGLYRLSKQEYYVLVKAGNIGTSGFGGHSHNDQTNFLLYVQNSPVFIDPGTYHYRGENDLRNLFRSTRYHNVVSLEDEEQNLLIENQKFLLFDRTKTKVIKLSENEIVCKHSGYKHLNILLQREIVLKNENEMVIIDSVVGNSVRKLKSNLHIHPSYLDIIQKDNLVYVYFKNFYITIEPQSQNQISIEDYLFSTRYNECVSSKKIIIDFIHSLCVTIKIYN